MTRLIFIFLIFLSTCSLFGQQDWTRIASPTDQTLKKIFFIDDKTGWAAGDSGTIIHTTNGGSNWTIQNSGVQSFIYDLFFLNKDLGWAVTWKLTPPFGTIILSTTNGGLNWQQTVYPEENIFMETIFFTDSLIGFMGGMPLLKTTNGGLDWYETNLDSNTIATLPVARIKFYNDSLGFACGGFIDVAGVMWKTTDAGENWRSEGVCPEPLNDFAIIDSLNISGLAGDPEGMFGMGILRSTDGGETWNYEESTLANLAFGIDYRTKTEGWSAGGYRFLKTSDSGFNWFVVNIFTPINIFDVEFVDIKTGYACGEKGLLLRYTGNTSNIEDTLYHPEDFKLYQNYPNPFNPTTKIKYTIPRVIANEVKQSLVTLKVYDVLGNEVATLVDEYKPAGSYEVEFSGHSDEGQNLPSGVYFYQLKVGDALTQTKKMMLLR